MKINAWINKSRLRVLVTVFVFTLAGLVSVMNPELIPTLFIRLAGVLLIGNAFYWLLVLMRKQLEKELNVNIKS